MFSLTEMRRIAEEKREDVRSICPSCGDIGLYVSAGFFWGFRCNGCGYQASNSDIKIDRPGRE